MDTRSPWRRGLVPADGPPSEPAAFDPFVRRAAAATALVTATLIGALFLWKIASVLLLLFAGVLLAVFLHGLARRVEAHTRLSYGWSLGLVVLAIVAAFGLLFWFIAPQISGQVEQMREVLPQSVDRLEAWLQQYGWGEYLVDEVPAPRDLVDGGGGATSGRGSPGSSRPPWASSPTRSSSW